MRSLITAGCFLLSAALCSISCNSGQKKRDIPGAQTGADALPQNDMVLVPAGQFWMGSEEGEVDEKPAHQVLLDSFYIDRFPITNAQYARFLLETGREKPLYWNDAKCNGARWPAA